MVAGGLDERHQVCLALHRCLDLQLGTVGDADEAAGVGRRDEAVDHLLDTGKLEGADLQLLTGFRGPIGHVLQQVGEPTHCFFLLFHVRFHQLADANGFTVGQNKKMTRFRGQLYVPFQLCQSRYR